MLVSFVPKLIKVLVFGGTSGYDLLSQVNSLAYITFVATVSIIANRNGHFYGKSVFDAT